MTITLKKFGVLLLVAGALLAIAVQAQAANTSRASCTVSPDPVMLNQPWSVSATGLTPNAHYYLNVTQAKDPSNNAHPNSSLDTDSTGSGTTYFPSTTWDVDGILVAGDFKVRVYPSQDPNAQGTANCKGTVV